MGYRLSVINCALPKPGFKYLEQSTESQDKNILWIVKINLIKNRIIRNFLKRVIELNKLMK